jgi:hypothetical protein
MIKLLARARGRQRGGPAGPATRMTQKPLVAQSLLPVAAARGPRAGGTIKSSLVT